MTEPLEIRQSASLGSYDEAVGSTLRDLEEKRFVSRLRAKDPTLWKSQDPELIRERLGWLTVVEEMRREVESLVSFAEEVRRAGFSHALLLGMGGSSLCAEVLRRIFDVSPGLLDLKVLDSTDPAAILEMERSLPLRKTLFIVSTKSGTTTETLALFAYFFEKIKALAGEEAGKQFIAITDGGSPLDRIAKARVFRRTYLNPPDIGGRYSALSYFGLVPAALIGIDTETWLGRAQAVVDAYAAAVPLQQNSSFFLGAALAALARKGRDKVTFILSPAIASFGSWAEQLLAESTGKKRKGLIPVVDEAPGAPAVYGDDRFFVRIGLGFDQAKDLPLRALEEAGHPVVRIVLRDALDLGAEFLRWEIATAVAGAILEVNPFDEPNVQESKDATERLLGDFLARGSLPDDTPLAQESWATLYAGENTQVTIKRPGEDLQGLLAAHLRQVQPGNYVALLAYLAPSAEHDALLQEIRRRLRDRLHAATTLGYGPRYLHSTGQLHKGGPNKGLFIQITADPERDLQIPGEKYTFGVLEKAQAAGDFLSLQQKDRRIVRLHLGSDVPRGLRKILDCLQGVGRL